MQELASAMVMELMAENLVTLKSSNNDLIDIDPGILQI